MSLSIENKHYSFGPIAAVAAIAVALMALLQALPENWHDWLRYDRAGISRGEWWRIVTGHFIHLGWSHLALNVAGLAIGTWLFGTERSPVQWGIATVLSTLACGLGLWWFSPDIQWCVGLSGVLHGLMLVGALSWAMNGEPAGWWLSGFWFIKLSWEYFRGEMPWSGSLTGGTVVTDAHLWGALGGLLYLALSLAWVRRRL
jgi:rhomboid family GlyGly-CTERM serine protease